MAKSNDSKWFWDRYERFYSDLMSNIRMNDMEPLVVIAGIIGNVIIHATTILRAAPLWVGVSEVLMVIVAVWWILSFIVCAIIALVLCFDRNFDVIDLFYTMAFTFITIAFIALFFVMTGVVPHLPFLAFL